MDKLILKKQRKRPNDNLYRIRVSGEAYEIAETLAEQTNQSMTEICSKMILFAYEHCEVKEAEETR